MSNRFTVTFPGEFQVTSQSDTTAVPATETRSEGPKDETRSEQTESPERKPTTPSMESKRTCTSCSDAFEHGEHRKEGEIQDVLEGSVSIPREKTVREENKETRYMFENESKKVAEHKIRQELPDTAIGFRFQTENEVSSAGEASALTRQSGSCLRLENKDKKEELPNFTVSKNQIIPVREQSLCKSTDFSGLDWLTEVDSLLINQHFTKYRIFPLFGSVNKYCIKSASESKSLLLEVVEKSKFRDRILLAQNRPFELKVFDGATEVLRFSRPFGYCSCLRRFHLQKITVTYPDGTLIGTVEQEPTHLVPKFQIRDCIGDAVLTIKGPKLTIRFGRDVHYHVLSKEGEQIGRIVKLWGGFIREVFTDVDNFKLEFPVGLDVNTKAVLLGACFLIDYMYYEMLGNAK